MSRNYNVNLNKFQKVRKEIARGFLAVPKFLSKINKTRCFRMLVPEGPLKVIYHAFLILRRKDCFLILFFSLLPCLLAYRITLSPASSIIKDGNHLSILIGTDSKNVKPEICAWR